MNVLVKTNITNFILAGQDDETVVFYIRSQLILFAIL